MESVASAKVTMARKADYHIVSEKNKKSCVLQGLSDMLGAASKSHPTILSPLKFIKRHF